MDKEKPQKKGQIVFVGSSSIRMWKLDKSFPGLDALNRGLIKPVTNHFRGVSCDDSIGLDVLGDYRACANDRAPADRTAFWEDGHRVSNPDSIADEERWDRRELVRNGT